MRKVLEIPAGEYVEYLRFINQPGLVVPAGKTLLQFYYDHRKGQMRLDDYDKRD